MSAHPTGQAAIPALNLWEAALQDLEPEERATISKHTQDTKPTDVLQIVEKRGQEAWKNRISFKGKSGEVVFLHDIFAKVARWVKKFVEVGDVAVQYDPAHAALPWAAVRFILQASINDIQRQAAVLEIVEDVARTIPLGAVHECLYLTGPSAAAESLKASLTKLYTLCWSSLAKALHHHDQSKMKRVLKSVLDSASDLNALSERIANQWTLVERSATLLRSEGLISHISKSQNRNEKLLRMMDDIKMPVSRIEAYVEETQDTLDEMKRDRILDSISTIPYPQHHAKVSRNVLSGTGKWLLDHQVVRNWFLSSASEILWLHGIPGSGKSCLVSVILEKLIEESAHCPSSRPVYFYCNRNPAERERADPTQILRSILRQLSMPWSTKTLPRSVMDKFDKERGSFFDLGDTLDLIIDIIKSRTITFIVLDALDECDANLRFELTDALETILRESQSLVKIFVSSRNDLDLVCWLRDYPNKEILSSDNQVDLAAFVDDEVNRRVDGRPRRLLRARKISDALRDDIKKTLKAQAQGMFRWAELQLQYLCKLLTEEDIRQRLGALPKDLTGIYHDIYQRNMSELRDTDPQYETDAKKIFHLMLSSYQPWGPVDMANMLEPAPNAALRKPEKVFGLTFHLITLDKELNILRFAHLSVREFFETNLSEFAPLRNMEANVAACFDYLEKTREFGYRPLLYPSQWWFSNLMELPIKEISAQSTNHLVEFLVRDVRTFESWLEEVQEEGRFIYLPDGMNCIRTIISNDAKTVFIACVLGFEDILSRLIDATPSCIHAKNLEGESTLVVACMWARNTNIVSLLLRKGAAINELVGVTQCFTALEAALSVPDPSVSVIRELLESGAYADCCNHGRGKTSALRLALEIHSTEIVELLLRYGADPNIVSGYDNMTPLYAACVEKDCPYEIVEKLLEAGARVNDVDDVDNDPLRAAAQSGREDLVTKLLSVGADVNALDAQRRVKKKCVSTLFTAIDSGEKHTARKLLFHGADPVPRNNTEHVILERLLFSGDAELAKSFLSAQNQDLRMTTIIEASRLLGEKKVITSLETLNIGRSDAKELSKAMELAAERGLLKVFKQLVNHASDCSLPDSHYSQVLDGTIRRRQVEMFKTLWTSPLGERSMSKIGDDSTSAHALQQGSPKYRSQTRFTSLLYVAAMGGSTEIFQFILAEEGMPTTGRERDKDAFPECTIPSATSNTIRNHGAWYLHAAVSAGQADMVELLGRLGADANETVPDCGDQNALCTALLKRSHPRIIKLLLKSGADINARMAFGVMDEENCKRQYGAALAIALRRVNEAPETSSAVIEALLEHGADANAADEQEGSILQLAISQGHIGATELLLAYGADANKGGGTSGSPLIAAVLAADEYKTGTKLIELLLKNGADVNAEYAGEYETAFRAALSKDARLGQQIFQLFLAHNVDLLATGRDGTQALYVACASGACDELRAQYLLEHGADINARGGEYGNALQAACAIGCPSTIVELLIAKGAEVNAKGGRFGNALQAASQAGFPRPLEILLANGADVNANDGKYGHALQAAAFSFHPGPTMKLLLSCGADINACGGRYGTALQAACANCSPSKPAAIRLLLSRGADCNVRGGKYGYALICAILQEKYAFDKPDIQAVHILLDGGADINCYSKRYGNALSAACGRSFKSVMMMLIKRGISLTQLAGRYEHALFVACRGNDYGRADVQRIRVLLDNGVDVNLRGKRYSCALEVAIKAKNLVAAKYLIERGADVRVETANDVSLLDIALRSSCSEMVDLLRANGA